MTSMKNTCQEFIYWQCQIRKYSARSLEGQLTSGTRPELVVDNNILGSITTVLLPVGTVDETGYLDHIFKKTHDPGERRKNAIKYFQSNYYQQPGLFGGELSATAPAQSGWVETVVSADTVELRFNQGPTNWRIVCEARLLANTNTQRLFTLAHNRLFNSALSPQVAVLLFSPDWISAKKD